MSVKRNLVHHYSIIRPLTQAKLLGLCVLGIPGPTLSWGPLPPGRVSHGKLVLGEVPVYSLSYGVSTLSRAYTEPDRYIRCLRFVFFFLLTTQEVTHSHNRAWCPLLAIAVIAHNIFRLIRSTPLSYANVAPPTEIFLLTKVVLLSFF